MSCPLTADWDRPDPRPVHVVEADLKRNAKRRARYADRKLEELRREREAQVARRVYHATEPFELG